jgi:hypothetical protein
MTRYDDLVVDTRSRRRAWAIFNGWAFGLFLSPLAAQWIGYPTAGVCRIPDGKTDLAVVPPCTADGRPDRSDWWVTEPDHDPTPNFNFKLRTW